MEIITDAVEDFCCTPAAEYLGDLRWDEHDDACDNYDGAPLYRDGMGPNDPVRCDND